MCVIAYKPLNIAFPEEQILKNCYDNNPDGAGFMYTFNGKVYIQKGYTSYSTFKAALDTARAKTGDNVPYVMHFRIATQGFKPEMTHPFPLSSNMEALKRTKCNCNIGVAHNGILSLTSDGSKEYSDTMKFITDYLSLIIRSYDWHKDDRTKTLIERLIHGSRLAILDKHGHCELMGEGWVEDKGIFYSNTSYNRKKVTYTWSKGWDWYDTFYDPYDEWDKYWNKKKNTYDFKVNNCPATVDCDDTYCEFCSNYSKCPYVQAVVND